MVTAIDVDIKDTKQYRVILDQVLTASSAFDIFRRVDPRKITVIQVVNADGETWTLRTTSHAHVDNNLEDADVFWIKKKDLVTDAQYQSGSVENRGFVGINFVTGTLSNDMHVYIAQYVLDEDNTNG